MIGDNWLTGDAGDRIVTVPLNINQLTFIVSGLKDGADHIQAELNNESLGLDPSDRKDLEEIRDENREMASFPESFI